MPGTPLYPKDQGTEWMNLKKQVKGIFTSANSRAAYTKIGAGILNVFTSLVIQAGAFIKAEYSTGNDGLYFGRFLWGSDDYEGLLVMNHDSQFALLSATRVSDGYGFSGIFDKEGNVVLSDDGTAEKGLARPWLEHTFVNTTELTSPPAARIASGTTDVAVVTLVSPIQHPKMHYNVYVQISVGGSTAEVKFKNLLNGETMHSFTTGSSGFHSGDFTLGDYIFGNDHQIDVTIRRASGSGNVGLTLISLAGRQS